jgi:uncharacterized lipoprotein YddW (UPF0748 family)
MNEIKVDKSYIKNRIVIVIIFLIVFNSVPIVQAEEAATISSISEQMENKETMNQSAMDETMTPNQTTTDQTSVENASVPKPEHEFNAVWISYLEFLDRLKDPNTGELGFTEERFHDVINEMFDNVVEMNMNAVVVHVRPFGDAMYPSDYFPWSQYISGKQGKDPGYDPLQYMVEAAHDRGLEFHAWVNPYRVTNNTTDVKTLSKDNQVTRWLTNKTPYDDRHVLTFGNAIYFNPADLWVQSLIRKGIEEIVTNYDVDGIHFDDYFYPSLGSNYKKNFDFPEYQDYLLECEDNKIKPLSIVTWRRENVNRMIKRTYETIKRIDENIKFGISPAGYLDNLYLNDRYYIDINTWLSKTGYVDYICPQLYWSFSHSIYPFDDIMERWLALKTNENIKMYIGIATYRAGSNLEPDWKNNPDVLKNMIEYGRKNGQIDGYFHFRYDFFYKKATQEGVTRMLEILK